VLADEFMGCHEQKILEKFVRIFLSIKDKIRSALVDRMTGDMDIAQAKAAFRVLRKPLIPGTRYSNSWTAGKKTGVLLSRSLIIWN
jgi:hypothetical protein